MQSIKFHLRWISWAATSRICGTTPARSRPWRLSRLWSAVWSLHSFWTSSRSCLVPRRRRSSQSKTHPMIGFCCGSHVLQMTCSGLDGPLRVKTYISLSEPMYLFFLYRDPSPLNLALLSNLYKWLRSELCATMWFWFACDGNALQAVGLGCVPHGESRWCPRPGRFAESEKMLSSIKDIRVWG